MQGKEDTCRLGFLTAVEIPQRGFVGGLLITNHQGRPLEFQCTTPLKPNRTQEILYGPTLVPFVLSEVIGKTLLERVGVKPHVVLIERADLLDLRRSVTMPVACLVATEDEVAAIEARIGPRRLRCHDDFAGDAHAIAAATQAVPESADLSEPFDRVRELLQETLASGSAA